MEVICSACGRRNPEDLRFCEECGTYLPPDLPRVAPIRDWAGAGPTATPQPSAAGPTATSPVGGEPAVGGAGAVGEPAAPGSATDPGGGPPSAGAQRCPSCGTDNDPSLRFCRHCAYQLSSDGPAPKAWRPPTAGSPQQSWWRRIVPTWTPGASDAARTAYRRTLSRRTLSLRYGAMGVVAALVIALLAWRGSPVGWVKGKYADIVDKTAVVKGVTVSTYGKAAPITGREVKLAIDNDPTSAWSTAWAAPTETDPDSGCVRPPADSGSQALHLTLPASADVRGLKVIAGLSDNRDNELVPKTLQIAIPDHDCQTVSVDDNAEWQTVKFSLTNTDDLYVRVIEVADPTANVTQQVSISEIQVLKRPY